MDTPARPIFDVWPGLRARLPFVELGILPSPIQPAPGGVWGKDGAPELWIKRDDQTSPIYGGNKVRTLEFLFGEAQARGATHVYSTGAFGSNHATATALHAPRVGLQPGVLLFPQPPSETAARNLRTMLASTARVRPLRHWSALPWGMVQTRRHHRRRGEHAFVMVPGGATPQGALGYVSAAFELGRQIERGELPAPRTVVVPVGSTCTSAGLLAGFTLAAQSGIGFRDAQGRPAPPRLMSVRVTPWPVTSAWRITRLAVRVTRLLATLTGDVSLAQSHAALRSRLAVDGSELGRGYGHATPRGRQAIDHFRAHFGMELDTTYSAKAAAALLRGSGVDARGASGEAVGAVSAALSSAGEAAGSAGNAFQEPVLFWSTKSSAPLPLDPQATFDHRPVRMRRWLETVPLK